MAECLLALGSNLGDRAATLRAAVAAIAALPATRLLARSAWHATAPIGGPTGQGAFLNGAVRIETQLSPAELFAHLLAVERSLGRTRDLRWQARTIDLDLLLYGDALIDEPQLTLPHPRMEYRRFVLDGAAEVAPHMLHAESGWTVAALRRHLDRGANVIAVAATDDELQKKLTTVGSVSDADFGLPAVTTGGAKSASETPPTNKPPGLVAWRPDLLNELAAHPKLILAVPPTGTPPALRRTILKLPPTGPIAWLPAEPPERTLAEARAAVQAVWPR